MLWVQDLQLSSPAFLSSTPVAMVSRHLGTFLFGGMACRSDHHRLDDPLKGHLRPHFLPNTASFSYKSSYITNNTCTRHPEDVLDAR